MSQCYDDEVEPLLDALRKAKAALYNVPQVGERYDQQHSDTHMRACLEIEAILNEYF